MYLPRDQIVDLIFRLLFLVSGALVWLVLVVQDFQSVFVVQMCPFRSEPLLFKVS